MSSSVSRFTGLSYPPRAGTRMIILNYGDCLQALCVPRKLQSVSVTVTKTYDNIQLDRSFCKQFIPYCYAEFNRKVIIFRALRKNCSDVIFGPIGYNSVKAAASFVVKLIC